MSGTARHWKGVGILAVGGLLLCGALVRAADPPPLSEQLLELGRQAVAQGRPVEARAFFQKALLLDPKNAEAERALQDRPVRLASRLQDPAPAQDKDAPAPAADRPKATIDAVEAEERVKEQQLNAYVADRIGRARELLAANQPDEAITSLRLTLEQVRSEQVREELKNNLGRQISTEIQFTVKREQQIELDRAEQLRLGAIASQTERAVAELNKNRETANILMVQFDQLMNEGQYNVLYNGGGGDIAATVAPFINARLVAQQARALDVNNATPYAAVQYAEMVGFLAQEMAYEKLKEYRFMQTMQDAGRVGIPHPDSLIIEYPPADFFRAITERRIKRYESVSLDSRDERTQAIDRQLEKPFSMPFNQETALEDVIKYTAGSANYQPAASRRHLDLRLSGRGSDSKPRRR